MRSFLALLLLLPLSACAPTGSRGAGQNSGVGDDDDAVGDDDDAVGDDDDATDAVNPFGEPIDCGTFATGTVTMDVDGLSRTMEVELPADPEGAPVLFAWHWLNGDATQTLDWMGIREMADVGYVVVAPESAGAAFEWDVTDPSDANVDLALFDAVLPCLWEQFDVDADRVYSTGMSAGGLMTTFLTMHRADVLAATAPFSGGAESAYYSRPAEPIPVLVTWGGPSDSYGGYSFDSASRAFIDLLDEDGHFVVACEHTAGHLPPSEAVDMLVSFLGDHRKGTASPWADGIPAVMPTWCE